MKWKWRNSMVALLVIMSLFVGVSENSMPVSSKGRLTLEQQKMADRIAKVAIDNYETYKILPSLAVTQACQESSLGVRCRGNNLWGIKSGAESYPTVEAGVHRYLGILNYKRYKNVRGETNFYSAMQRILNAGYCKGNPHYVQQCIYLYETYGFSKYDKQLLQKLEKKKELARKKKEESKREKFVGSVGWTLRYDPTVPDHSVKVSKKFAKKGTILIFEDYDLYGIYDTIAEGKSNDYVIYINDPEMDGHIVEIESKEEAKG